MADWEEIKRLAADFQRIQASENLERLSERNCIDLVKRLTELKIIEIIWTCDGKEMLTPEHLLREIQDEIYVNGGRVHLNELASKLKVDYQHVENMSKRLDPDEYNLILGQIIHSTYRTTLGKQICDTMLSTGQLSIADFAKTLDLPTEFLSTVVEELLPKVMDDPVVSHDKRTYYTRDMMDRYKSIIAGTLTTIKRPTSIASIMKRLEISERLFTPIVDGLIKDGRIDATIENRQYVPAIYAREQNEWIDTFYSSNYYVEYDILLRKDIKQPKSFLKKRFPDSIQLKSCIVSPTLMTQIEAQIEECTATDGLIDISSILPPSIEPEDVEQLLQDLFKKKSQLGKACMLFNKTNVCSMGYIANCKKWLDSTMETKAKEHLQEGKLINYFLGGTLKSNSSKRKQHQEGQEQVQEQEQHQDQDQPAGSEDQTQKPSESSGTPAKTPNTDKKKQIDDIELTAEDLKRERRQKKGKAAAAAQVDRVEVESEDEGENMSKKSKGSRKSGGGAQGREVKQKAVKKKYMAGSTNYKGRAARREVAPSSETQNATAEEKEPLVFLDQDELVGKLKERTRESGDFSEELFETIANMLEADLNKKYESLARKVLDDYLRTAEAEGGSESGDEENEIDLVE